MQFESLERITTLWSEEEQRKKNGSAGSEFLPALPEIPSARYIREDFFELEKRWLWTKAWLLVGHGDEIPNRGCYKRVELPGAELMLVRSGATEIRAFYNTCQHRGAMLVRDQAGTKNSFVCPYHAWNYDLDGHLKFVPDEPDFPNLDKCKKSLKAVRCERLGNLIFICMDEKAGSLDDFLGGMKDIIADVPWASTRLYQTYDFEVSCNWKFIHDAFSETYHVQFVHPDSVNQAINRTFTARQLLRNGHNAMVVKSRSPEAAGGRSNVFDRAPADAGVAFRPTVSLNPLTRIGQRSYNIFPNVTIPVAENLTAIMVLLPRAVDRTTMRLYYVKVDPAAPLDTEVDRATVAAFNAIAQEDFSALTGIQTAAGNSAIPTMTLGYGEQFIYNFHRQLDLTIGRERIPEELRVAQVPLHFID